jgi:hypothetical protein
VANSDIATKAIKIRKKHVFEDQICWLTNIIFKTHAS